MELETLSRANMLVQKIKEVEDQCSELYRQHERCEKYLEPSTRSYGKKDYFYFEDVICYLVLPNQGNGEQKFSIRGDDPDAKRFYLNMIAEMQKFFEKKMDKSHAKLKQLKEELDAL